MAQLTQIIYIILFIIHTSKIIIHFILHIINTSSLIFQYINSIYQDKLNILY